jgi:Protein of unknown function (DUF3738)
MSSRKIAECEKQSVPNPRRPVLDRTSLDGRYDCVLDEQLFDGTSDPNLAKKVGLDEFGFALVPSREPVEMLIVEKVKD